MFSFTHGSHVGCIVTHFRAKDSDVHAGDVPGLVRGGVRGQQRYLHTRHQSHDFKMLFSPWFSTAGKW